MNIAGIDYSLRGPAVCIFTGDYAESFELKSCKIYFLTHVKKYSQQWGNNIFGESFEDWTDDSQRYESIADWAIEKVQHCDQIALEGYSFGSKGNRLFQIAENTGILKYKIYQKGIPLEVVPPTRVKKFATDKGNANKQDMYMSFLKETKYKIKTEMSPGTKEITNPVSDIVDSFYVCKFLYNNLMMK